MAPGVVIEKHSSVVDKILRRRFQCYTVVKLFTEIPLSHQPFGSHEGHLKSIFSVAGMCSAHNETVFSHVTFHCKIFNVSFLRSVCPRMCVLSRPSFYTSSSVCFHNK